MKSLLKWLIFSLTIGVLSSCIINDTNIPREESTSTGNPTPPNVPPNTNPVIQGRGNDFPYNLIPDTISALTCSRDVIIGNKFFTLNTGAYYAHGLQLTEDFKTNNNITQNTPPQKVLQLIERSPFKKARARLAFHDESNLNTAMKSENRILQDWFPPLNNPTTLNLLSQLRSVFTSRSPSNTRVQNSGTFKANLPISGGQLIQWASSMGEGSQGNILLTLTYSFDGKTAIYSSKNRPYGRGYKLIFEDPYKADYLIQIKEENLSATKREGYWECPERLQFMVLRSTSSQANPFNREFERYSHSLPKNLLQEGYCRTGRALTRIERDFFNKEFGTNQLNQLPFEVGNTIVFRENSTQGINTGWPCIKLKSPGCYGTQNYFRLEFDPQKLDNCKRFHQIDYFHHSNEEVYEICPAFLSVCYRFDNDR